MSLFPQLLLDVHDELIVDLFAGGGGASVGIEMATGREVDVAINHDADAVAMHAANHPQTRHLHADVFEVDPREATEGRPVGLLWASPDCTFYSKARGGKPIREAEKKRRALAWVVTRWAGQVQPRVIVLENVEEFAEWGPLVARRDRKTGRVKKSDGTVADPGERVPVDDQELVPCPDRGGKRFRAWIRSLERHGYEVEWRELRACDYGAPTIRNRLFLIARCDGRSIVWPEATHGPGTRKPFRTAAECIDWAEPMCSIFATPAEAREWGREMRARGHRVGTPRRPLAENTMARIARGVKRFILDAAEPFIVGETVTAKGDAALVAPTLAQTGYGERDGQAPRVLDLHEPLGTVVGAGQKHALVAAFLARHFTGMDGIELDSPNPTITTIDHHSLVTAKLEARRAGDGRRSEAHRGQGHQRHPRGAGVEAPEPERDTAPPAPPARDEDQERLPGGEGLLEGAPVPDIRASPRVDRAGGPNTGGNGHQPPGREEDEQQPREPRAGDPEAEHPPFDPERSSAPSRLLGGEAPANQAQGAGATGERPDVPGDRRAAGDLSDERVPGRAGEVAAFLTKFYGQGVGQPLDEPAGTVTTKDRMGLVTVHVQGEPYVIVDIAMRMLQPRELYRAQGFPDSYEIEVGANGERLTKAAMVRLVGNSVCPPVARVLCSANVPELQARDEVEAWRAA